MDRPAEAGVTGRGDRTVHRRTGAGVFFLGVGLLVLGYAAVVTPEELKAGGWRAAVVPWAVAVPLAVLAVLAGVLPRLVTTDRHVEVHNMFVRYVIPYGLIAEARLGRLGLAVRTVGGQRVPVLAFGRSVMANTLNGDAAAQRALDHINERTAQPRVDPAAEVRRDFKRTEIGVVGTVVTCAALVLALV
jgi:hypothetical protein